MESLPAPYQSPYHRLIITHITDQYRLCAPHQSVRRAFQRATDPLSRAVGRKRLSDLCGYIWPGLSSNERNAPANQYRQILPTVSDTANADRKLNAKFLQISLGERRPILKYPVVGSKCTKEGGNTMHRALCGSFSAH